MKQQLQPPFAPTISSAKFEMTFQRKSDYFSAVKQLETRIERMFHELGKNSPHVNNMIVCATEIANNAAAKEDQFPITIRMERKDGSLFFETLQAKKFKNPQIKLPDGLPENGRGCFLVDSLTGHNLHLEGENGRVWFIYSLNGKPEDKVAKQAIARVEPLVGN